MLNIGNRYLMRLGLDQERDVSWTFLLVVPIKRIS
jgi:hypothetical protein